MHCDEPHLASNEKTQPIQWTEQPIGALDWPVPLLKIDVDMLLKCGICGNYLALVAQVYVPLTLPGKEINEQVLYILGCTSPNCGLDPASWCTIRFQKDVSQGEAAAVDPTESVGDSSAMLSDCPTVLSQTDEQGWGDENSWGGDAADGNNEPDAISLEELQSSLVEAGYLAAAAATRHHHVSNQGQETQSSSPDVGTLGQRNPESNLPTLPCFYVYSDSEVLIPDRNANVNGKVQELVELKPLPAVEEPAAAVEGVEEVWEGEEYEPDHSLSADRTYLEFKKKLDLNPEQCYRYCFGAQPLWAREVQQQPGTCAACGGPCVYEMELMPPLLYFLQRAHKDLPPS
ncbi:hypothetical protein BDL97_10G006500 [Sphagnum fallax]|nr:hypothetical protein BDL97_10G006500 [Sphagnum fallax]KAH8948987.1 hypothetical protein BDL97_10G006500 [Sphagnum fallax]